MFDSTILEIGLGLVLVYFLMSLFCTALNEWIMRVFSLRAKTLKSGISRLLGEKEDGLLKTLYQHPMIKGLTRKGWWDRLLRDPEEERSESKGIKKILPKASPGPSSISSRNFALAVMDILIDEGAKNNSGESTDLDLSRNISKNLRKMLEDLTNGIEAVPVPDELKQMFRTQLKTAIDKGTEAIKAFQTSVEEWFDDAMDRVSGWYKRKAQLIILVIAVVACAALNVDTFAIANALSEDEALRASVVAAAEARAEEDTPVEDNTTVKPQVYEGELKSLNLPIGWTVEEASPMKVPDDVGGWLVKICGILLTAFLVSLGAPFWFDLLNKIVNLRSSGNKPKKAEETKTN